MSSCTWPVSRTCLPEVEADEDQALLNDAIDTAVGVLWSFTGRQYGCCPRIIRPCPSPQWQSLWIPGRAWYPELNGGIWRNIGCACGPTCSRGGPGMVHLPGPVCSVTAVTVDGVVWAEDRYRLEGDWLYSTVGDWPDQDLQRPLGVPNTWSIEYLQGQPPPAGAATMVALLAKEFYTLCKGEKCSLPKRTEQVTRRGVTMKMADPEALFENYQTGVTQVDMWIAAHNPHRLSAPAAVSSPDFEG